MVKFNWQGLFTNEVAGWVTFEEMRVRLKGTALYRIEKRVNMKKI